MPAPLASFHGTLREGIPQGTLEGLAARLRTLGMRVTEESLPLRYRESAVPRCALRAEHAAPFVGTFDRLRVWQEDTSTLRYEGTFARWAQHFAVAWVGFVVGSAAIVSLCVASPWFTAVLAVLALGSPLLLLARHRQRVCAWVERTAREEMRKVYVPWSIARVAFRGAAREPFDDVEELQRDCRIPSKPRG